MTTSTTITKEEDPLTGSNYPEFCLHTLFRLQAKRTPNAIAVVSESESKESSTGDIRRVTYAALDDASDRLAAMLLRRGVGKNDPVGIFMHRCAEYVLAYIAILKAGAGYAVLDPAYPVGLLSEVLATSNPKVVVTTGRHAGRLPDSQSVITLQSEWAACLAELTDADRTALAAVDAVDLDALAYVVFSSGTTGKPKGIACPHRGAVFSYHRRSLDVPYGDNAVNACNIFFVWELLRPLLRGQRLAVVADDIIYDPDQLTAYLQRVAATRMLFTPSLLETVLDNVSADQLSRRLSSMRIILLCGEVVTVALLKRIRATLPQCRIWNSFSISECADVAHADITDGVYTDRKFAPVGKVFPGVGAHVFDEHLNEVPRGAVGELYVSGPTLALHYVKQPELTAQRFPTVNGQRLYKTGDRAKLLADGQLEILGRCDSMVKIRGYSVELRAIEAAILALADNPVTSCAVVAQGDEGDDKVVVAYLVLRDTPSSNASCRDVRTALKRQLPHYMIPGYFVEMAQLPRDRVSGKLDWKALPRVDLARTACSTADEEKTAPRNDVEQSLHAIWADILSLGTIDVVHDSFFDVGGHSLLAARLVRQVTAKLGKRVSVSDMYTHFTIEALARFIEGDDAAEPQMEEVLDLEREFELFDRLGHGQLSNSLFLRAFRATTRFKHRIRSALVTGATGWLGSFLLYELLTATELDVDVVYCVVRATGASTPLDRVKRALERRGLWRDGFEKRIEALSGDVSRHHLSLAEEDYYALSFTVDLVVHCAALVNLVLPYAALQSANVVGTANMLDFVVHGKLKRLCYISTNGVFPETGLQSCREDADLASVVADVKTGYGQSKWVAERLVQRAAEQGLPVVIFRPGNMGPDTGERGGNESWNGDDFNYLVLTGCIHLGAAPDVPGWLMEMTPVDVAAHAIIKIVQDNANLCEQKTYHVTNCANCLTAAEYFDTIRNKGHAMEKLSWHDWMHRLSASSKPALEALQTVMATTSPQELQQLSTFNNDAFRAACSSLGITIPKISEAVMAHYADLWLKAGVTSPPPQLSSCRPLSGKVVIITGASSGIGASVAETLAAAGASVAIGGRRFDRLKEMAATLTTKTASHVFAHQVDVTDRAQVKLFVANSEAALGSCDIFINNAGVMHYTRLEHSLEDLWDKEVDVNCKGFLHGIGAVLPGMIARGRGHIVATSSDAARRPFAGLSVYSGTKSFVEATCRGLRLETADKGIKVTTIQPGDCKTELTSVVHDSESYAEFAQHNKDRAVWLDPEDVAQAVLYAVSAPPHVGVNEILIEPRGAPI